MTGTATEQAQPALDMHDPASVELAILGIHQRLHRGVEVIGQLNEEHKALARGYDEAKAQAYLDYAGPQMEKRHAAELATIPMREQVDEAKVKLDYARDHARVLEKEMSGLQSILADLRALLSAERGRG